MAQFDVDPVARVCERVGAQILQHDVEKPDGRDAADQHKQCRIGFMWKDLVDDNLKEQGRYKREYLHK
ncbi:hypothetical protein ACVIM5_000661 [Bradyrhizobium sp. USDA 4512]